jgi:hypothetical protein
MAAKTERSDTFGISSVSLKRKRTMARAPIKVEMEKLAKKDTVMDEAPPRNLLRADVAPIDGYSLVVDNRFKTHFATAKEAEDAASKLKEKYPMLLIQVYDAAKKTRTLMEAPKA